MKDIKELVKDYLAEHHAWEKKEDGNYHFEIYVDYRDELEDSTAQEILESNTPRDTLIEKLWDRNSASTSSFPTATTTMTSGSMSTSLTTMGMLIKMRKNLALSGLQNSRDIRSIRLLKS